GRVASEQLRLRLTEGERLGAASLHLPEQEQIEADEQQPRQEIHDVRRDRWTSVLSLDGDIVLVEIVDLGLRVLHRKTHVELRYVASLEGNRRAELARDVFARLDLHLADVVSIELGLVLRVRDERCLIRARAGQLNQRDGDQEDEEPERERLGKTTPVHVLFRGLWRHGYWHLLQARDVREVPKIFCVIQTVSD